MTKAQLLELCTPRGVKGVSSGSLKADIISAILANREGRSDADT